MGDESFDDVNTMSIKSGLQTASMKDAFINSSQKSPKFQQQTHQDSLQEKLRGTKIDLDTDFQSIHTNSKSKTGSSLNQQFKLNPTTPSFQNLVPVNQLLASQTFGSSNSGGRSAEASPIEDARILKFHPSQNGAENERVA